MTIWRATVVTLVCLGLTTFGMVGPATSAALADPADESQDFRFPGADTIALHDGSNKYITYGASVPGPDGRINVPYSITGSGSQIATSPDIDGDAMPGGPGAWADQNSGIWSPGAWYQVKDGVGRYYLFYTAKRNATDQRCIGVARSRTPTSGFIAEPNPIVCPDKDERWALDADIFEGPSGGIWMTWRDGQRAEPGESAISVMLLGFQTDGTVDRESTPVVVMRSDNLEWPRFHDGTGVVVIENPSIVYRNGSFYLFYSGNRWQTNLYATGIAHCGAKIDDGLCAPMPGPRRAWFSYGGPLESFPADMRRYGLPGNKRGPGAIDVHEARGGQLWVTWNYLTGDSGLARKSRVGILNVTGSGADADFRVSLP